MSTAKNPTEKVMTDLELSWLDASEHSAQTRLFIWRIPAGGESLLDGFIALQQHPEGRTLPDLFLGLTTPFETGFGYSEALGREFVEHYEATPDAAEWQAEPYLPCYSPAQLRQLLQGFADRFAEDLRYLVLVLKPSAVSDDSALTRWLNGWLEQGEPAPRLLLIDTVEQPVWQPLLDAHPHEVQLIVDDIDGMKVMHQTAQQQTDPDGDRLLFRRYLADAMLLLEKGTAAQVAARGDLALAIARQRGWADQQAMMHNLIAGGWLKGNDPAQAVAHYRQAQDISGEIAEPTLKGQLRTQSTFGEAGAWFAKKEYLQAAKRYRQAALEAQAIPHPVFEMEGWRMSGFCLWLAGHRPTAMEEYARAVKAAESVPLPERGQTTLPLVFQDLLRIHDKRRTEAIEACAARWQREKRDLIQQTEARLPAQPGIEQVKQAESRLQLQLEAMFTVIREERENLIRRGDESFRRVIRLAREKLHPHWNGLPDIAHPFDAPPGEWQSLPAWGETDVLLSESAGSNPL
ncbi:hypothetical protein GA0061071_10269 [Kosakonia oryzendophytica]|uniref:Tetratricopeptide repeat-containing protein n=1 Tax=Kosakonia oryzendophytica TaxID=1005665 RepID=A0A1C3ZQ14_9ENTR|nr:hypothetical protein [Kosakonia oryzendophytica]SCB84468.1 hypothetical protein GA0061071_10269 [Kosakonia oryzendophytica]